MERGRVVLGVSADFHDAAAALLVDGRIVAAAEEERFTRVKHDAALPQHAIEWCLSDAGIPPGGLDTVAFYEKPMTAYERLLVTMARQGPRGFPTLAGSVARWSRSRLWVGARLEKLLSRLGHDTAELLYAEHHDSHAASAFFPSPFERAAILTFDGVGEWASTSIAHGRGNQIHTLKEQRYPDSLGLLYSTMTAHCGFPVNDGEQKLMALAPFGRPSFLPTLRSIVSVADDGSFQLDMRHFGFERGARMGSRRLDDLLGGPPRDPSTEVTDREADIARSTQDLIEEIVLRIARTAHELTGERAVCLSGGVALNCVANGRIAEEGAFDDLWVQPAAGDSGSAIGAALWAWHQIHGAERHPDGNTDAMSGAFLGPRYERDEVARFLRQNGVPFHDPSTAGGSAAELIAERIDQGEIVGWFSGRMEFGPRALGHRSILADARDPDVATRINKAIKRRDGFQPFAPAVLGERAHDWFDVSRGRRLPYMAVTARIRADRRTEFHDAPADLISGFEVERSEIPSCTHVDLSARVQTVDRSVNPELHEVLRAFERRTGCPVLLNTSFNGRGEPIVCTPADALRSFRRLGLDAMALEGLIIERPAGALT
jgi:carbamoyltransferase